MHAKIVAKIVQNVRNVVRKRKTAGSSRPGSPVVVGCAVTALSIPAVQPDVDCTWVTWHPALIYEAAQKGDLKTAD